MPLWVLISATTTDWFSEMISESHILNMLFSHEKPQISTIQVIHINNHIWLFFHCYVFYSSCWSSRLRHNFMPTRYSFFFHWEVGIASLWILDHHDVILLIVVLTIHGTLEIIFLKKKYKMIINSQSPLIFPSRHWR